MTDGRSATARRFKDLIDDISADLGGKDRLSQLVRRASMLSAESERMEAASVRGEAFDIHACGVLSDRLGRLLQRIGLRRVPREMRIDEALCDPNLLGAGLRVSPSLPASIRPTA